MQTPNSLRQSSSSILLDGVNPPTLPPTDAQTPPDSSASPSVVVTPATSIVVSPTTSSCPTPKVRRIWQELHDVPLMQEIIACGAHVPGKCEILTRLAEVAPKLNSNANIAFLWLTDGKHCRDRFKLLMDKWKALDSARAAASGGAEPFGEFEQLCTDIREEMDAHKLEIEEALKEKEEKAQQLVGASAEVRDMALNRFAVRNGSSDATEDSATERASKIRRVGGSEQARNLQAAICALENGERERTEMLGDAAAREDRRLVIEERCFEREATDAVANHALNLRRVALEERRAADDAKRDREHAEERRMQLRIQASMLEFLSKFTDKGGIS